MEFLDTYLSLNLSYRDCYIRNNAELRDKAVTDQMLYYNIHNDMDIIFNAIKLSPSKQGYRYWKDAIFIIILNDGKKMKICNEIYPAIAQKYDRTAISVERAMRLCFENAMYNNAKDESNFVFDYLKNYLLFPRNSEILAKLTELVMSKDFQRKKFSL
ncbi:MAG: hypothetical protein IJ538_01555 [Clostridia bacterium]|nr:hypothetical protein [Clostridia bacterium]